MNIPSADGVDPSRVPKRALADGTTLPAIGFGTFGSDKYTGDDVAAAVVDAASVGYRHFDCALSMATRTKLAPRSRQ